jgi:hypothetical protein
MYWAASFLAVPAMIATLAAAPPARAAREVPNWIEKTPTSPPARYGAAMAYDVARGQVVLFGGNTGKGIAGDLDDTWTWNGNTWTQERPATHPGDRRWAVMAYDAARGQVVLFGGSHSRDAEFGDTWTWDGSTWTRHPQSPENSPPARYQTTMAYDAARGEVVMFGGGGRDGSSLGDTWTWNGSIWTRRSPAGSPSARRGAAMTCFPSPVSDTPEPPSSTGGCADGILLFGGFGPGGQGDLSVGPFGDTWTWDGSTWTQERQATGPSARSRASMTHDGAGHIVLFGGDSLNGEVGDTWIWLGRTWGEQKTAGSPDPRSGAAMAYDSARGEVILFGGSGSDIFGGTWQWTASIFAIVGSWTRERPATSPPACLGPAMANTSRNLVLFGGFTQQSGAGGPPGGHPLDETWTWDGGYWVRASPTTSPPARYLATMSYDVARDQVVLFGGLAGGELGDTWTWDNRTWTRQSPTTSPPARYGAAMAYDSAHQVIVLFGGSGTSTFDDTWTWDGSTWTQQSPATSPPARYGAAMAYDVARGQIVLFGGNKGKGTAGDLDDTWTWNGSTWTQERPPTHPADRRWAAMAYDAARDQVVLFGGSHTRDAEFPGTWTWNGNTWTRESPATTPRARFQTAMATGTGSIDSVRGEVVMFGGGGSGEGAFRELDDTWVYCTTRCPRGGKLRARRIRVLDDRNDE